MKIRMKGVISGTRNGQPWPGPGSLMDLPDAEAAMLCDQGMATPVAVDKVEKAVAPKAEERAPTTVEEPPAPKRDTRPYEERTVEELQDVARKKDMPVSGTKDELIARLRGSKNKHKEE